MSGLIFWHAFVGFNAVTTRFKCIVIGRDGIDGLVDLLESWICEMSESGLLSENDMSICVGWLNCIFFWPVVMIGSRGLNREILVCCHKVSTDVQLGERSSKGLSRNQEGLNAVTDTLKALVLLPVVCTRAYMCTYTYVRNRVNLSVFCSIALPGFDIGGI